MTTVGKIIVAVLGIHLFILLVIVVSGSCSCRREVEPASPPDQAESAPVEPEKPAPPVYQVRPFPDKFPRRACMPDVKESEASGAISNSTFSPGRDLVFVDDPRVWWESDFDGETDDEDDHSMHRAMEPAFRRLVELVAMSNATLRVQEAYRPSSIHAALSLHKEGRALDLTCPDLDPSVPKTNPRDGKQVLPTQLSLEILAKLCWAAGFDWVYYEVPKNSGAHLHVSVRRDADGGK
jgi:hypothetical protein